MNEILCAGAGRGGHGLLPRLAAHRARRFAILDDDLIEPVNLPNLRLDRGWIGWPKAKELAFALAGRHGATVRWADATFSPDLLDERSPYADMVYRQRLILALTDSMEAQLALAVTAAKLEIPFLAVRVFEDGGGDVFVQLDTARDPCYPCFTGYMRRTGGRVEPLRGRDLPVGAGDRVDAFAAEVAAAVLGLSADARRRVFAPHPRFGFPSAWEVAATGEHAAETPIFFQRVPDCPVCGSRDRRARELRVA
jgi:ThiF family protein